MSWRLNIPTQKIRLARSLMERKSVPFHCLFRSRAAKPTRRVIFGQFGGRAPCASFS